MPDLKISQLNVASTPLAGTELVPIVQGGITEQTTVAAVLSAGLPVSASTLSASGNTTLGDASTDTVTVNGRMGIGGSGSASAALRIDNNALSGTNQDGILAYHTGTSGATANIRGIVTSVNTEAASYTVTNVAGFWAGNAGKGAGSTITNQYGVFIADQTNGTNNYGITSAVSSGTNKWNIYASGTAANYFAGKALVGTTTDQDGRLIVRSTGNNYTNSAVAIVDSANTTKLQMLQTTTGFFYMTVNGTDDFVLKPTESVFNESGADIDFRVESDTNTHALFVEGTNSNVKIGGSAERATTVGTNHLDIFNGTAPVGTLTNGISIYSSAGEAYVMDAAGNATLFSPHDAETNEWIFKSKHTPTGKVLKIDVERLLRFVNDHFGLDAVQEFIET